MSNLFNTLINPKRHDIPATPEAFLESLGGPTIIRLQGQRHDRCRAVVTLLHGNEPSGFIALHHLLREGLVPEVDMLLGIVSVSAALEPPVFTHRCLPGRPDINRLFRGPFSGGQGALAAQLLALIRHAQPEAVLDIHNTSGHGPAFAVSVQEQREYLCLASLFTHRWVIIDLKLGALIEVDDLGCPVLTVECGGAGQPEADQVAIAGLTRFFSQRELLTEEEPSLDIYRHPLRLELQPEAAVSYADAPQQDVDITLPHDLDKLNFGVTWPDMPLGWLGAQGLKALRMLDRNGRDRITEFFVAREGILYPRERLRLFIVTTQADIAKSDCLLYAVKEQDRQR